MKETIQGAARSRTVWLGMIAAVLGVIQANPQAIAPFVEPHWLGLINMLVGIGIVVVRFDTQGPLGQ